MKILSKCICILAILGASTSYAHDHGKDKGKPHPPVTKEEREKMAANMDKMAACLRSDKPVDECHEEMHAGMKDGSCPMMGEHGKHHHSEK
ncbi:MAG: hypothetical protein ACXVA9_01150 [Bdellovibrionales bacterium]